jgi:16S rRNA (guanine966-N2)-methyltransferase
MRIIAGTLKGRTFDAPPGMDTRPTTDAVRETVFDALNFRFDINGATVLDLCCGSASYSFEAISRGAARATCIDRNTSVCKLVRESATKLGITDRVTVIAGDVPAVLDAIQETASLVFYDAPYMLTRANQTVTALNRARTVALGGVVVLEHGHHEVVMPVPGWLQCWHWSRGATVVTMLQRME